MATTRPPRPTLTKKDNLEYLNLLIKSTVGIDGLGQWALDLWNRGFDGPAIIQMLRYGTDDSAGGRTAHAKYLAAFPKIDSLVKEGILSGENPEAQYIQYRETVRESAKRYGLMDNLITDAKISDYLTNRVSATELVSRMQAAAQAVATTPTETLSALQEYYNVQNGDLISFYLNPTETEEVLQKRYVAARIGSEGMKQKFALSRQEAEALAMTGMSPQEASQALGQAYAQEQAFTSGPGAVVNRQDIMENLQGNEEAARKLENVAQSRVGRFQENSGFQPGKYGVSGLESSSTR